MSKKDLKEENIKTFPLNNEVDFCREEIGNESRIHNVEFWLKEHLQNDVLKNIYESMLE